MERKEMCRVYDLYGQQTNGWQENPLQPGGAYPQQPYGGYQAPYYQDPYAQQPYDPYGQQWQDPYGGYQQTQQWQPPAPPQAGETGAGKKEKKGKKGDESAPAKPQTPAGKLLHGVLNALYWVLCIAIVAGSAMFAFSKDPRKNYFGYRMYSVLTQSMVPQKGGPPGGFHKGDMIIIKQVKPEDIKVNDIVTFNPRYNDEKAMVYLTHRVVKVLHEMGGVEGLYFQTKGDANPSADPPIMAEMVIGKKVGMVPMVGTILNLLKKNYFLTILMIISFFGCIFMLRWYFSKPQPKEGSSPPPPGPGQYPAPPPQEWGYPPPNQGYNCFTGTRQFV
jgi:signal peptidase I